MLTRALVAILTLVLASTVFAEPPEPAPAAALPGNLDFEAESTEPWFVPGPVAQGGWSVSRALRTDATGAEVGHVLVLRREGKAAKEGGDGAGFGNVMQSFPAAAYRGKRIVLTAQAWLPEEGAGRMQMWLRVDRAGGKPGAFDNMNDRPMRAMQWTDATITADVDEDAELINMGFMVIGGSGPAYIDNVALKVMEQPKKRSEGPRPTTDAELANLIAFAKVYGYVRHYHPSDAMPKRKDWTPVLLRAADVGVATTSEQFVERMQKAFGELAPGATFTLEKPDEPALKEGDPVAFIVSTHRGLHLGPMKGPGIYYSQVAQGKTFAPVAGAPRPPERTTREFKGPDGKAVWVSIPLTTGAEKNDPPVIVVAGEDPSIADRVSRFACVIEFWNVIQHAYPYHDVVNTRWDQVLREALWKAATDKTEEEFTDTLERMCAALHDGHGQIVPARPAPVYFLPFAIVFVGDEPVVTEIDPVLARSSTVSRGDVIERIGDKTAAELLQDAREHESSATEQFLKVRAARRMSMFRSADPVAVTVRTPEGKMRGFSFTPVPFDGLPKEAKPPMVSEVKAGIWYIDLDRVTQQDLEAVLPKLNEPGCKGVVFDLRGYPSQIGFEHLGLFTDAKMSSAQWNVPIVNWPDRENIAWQTSSWPVMPKTPRFKGKAVWITDGRAISAAETYLGIVEHYKLGAIVGETTAGTNGNINPTPLPLGYTVIYTGMKVLKHDGSRHHGVGIKPTVPVARTIEGIAAGRDELLERAIGVVEGAK